MLGNILLAFWSERRGDCTERIVTVFVPELFGTSTPRFSLSILYMNASLCTAIFDGLKAWQSLGYGCKGVLHGWYSAVGKSTSNQPAWILSSRAAILTNSQGLQQVTSVLPDYWSSLRAWTRQKAHGLQKKSAQWRAECVSWWKGGLIGCMYSTCGLLTETERAALRRKHYKSAAHQCLFNIQKYISDVTLWRPDKFRRKRSEKKKSLCSGMVSSKISIEIRNKTNQTQKVPLTNREVHKWHARIDKSSLRPAQEQRALGEIKCEISTAVTWKMIQIQTLIDNCLKKESWMVRQDLWMKTKQIAATAEIPRRRDGDG